MRYASLFSGIGGFDCGFDAAGLECALQVEIDAACQRILARHWPNTAKHRDVREVENVGSVGLICGGFPCQDLSVAGRRKGLAGERSGLWFEFLRIIAGNKPRWVVIENVPGLLSSNGGRDFAIIVQGLVKCGYGVAWRILDAQYFGVAQRRRRVFIVGSLGDGRCAKVLFESEGVRGDTAPRREARATTASGLTASLGHHGHSSPRGDGSDNLIAFAQNTRDEVRIINGDGHISGALGAEPGMHQQTFVAGTMKSNGDARSGFEYGDGLIAANNFGERAVSTALSSRNQRIDGDTETFVVNCFNGYTGGADDNDAQAGHIVFDERNITSSDNRSNPRPGDPCHTLHATPPTLAFTERTRTEGRTFESQDELAYALTNPGSGGRTHSRQIAGGFGVRRLTPTECERLQGFPDGWTAGESDSTRYRMLGNAVCVPVAGWIGRRILEAKS